MLTLHHLEYSQSYRVLWLLEELDIEYELKLYDRDPKTMLAPSAYKAVSPLGTAPVITDGDITLAETSAILDYILDLHPNTDMRPDANAGNRAQYLFWFHASQGSLMPLTLMSSLFKVMTTRMPFFLKPMANLMSKGLTTGFIRPRMQALLAEAESALGKSDYFAGDDISLADILMSYPIQALHENGALKDYPNCVKWVKQIEARPGFQSAKEKDGRETAIFSMKK